MRNPVNPMNMTNIAGRNFQNHWPKLANWIVISGSQWTSTYPRWIGTICAPPLTASTPHSTDKSLKSYSNCLPTNSWFQYSWKHLFQKSIDPGTLPTIWKDAYVAPLYKKGERSNPANYRPISLTCFLCKTLEHIVASSITNTFPSLISSMNSNMASMRSALVNHSSSCWSMIFSNPSIRKSKLISFCLTSARLLIKSATRNSFSNYMTMV